MGLWKHLQLGDLTPGLELLVTYILCEACGFHECEGGKAVVVPKNDLSIDASVTAMHSRI